MVHAPGGPQRSALERRRALSPAKVVALSFLAAIAVGTLLLLLPVSQASGQPIPFLTALFTATSAVCVTGLVLVDTGSAWTPFGQSVIMLLIHIGGLGLVTLGTLLALLLGRRVGFQERLRVAAQVNALQVGGVVRLVRTIFLLALGFELLGALLLYPTFTGLYGPGRGAFYAFFHSVSAFNNAGFALYPDSLVRFVGDPAVNLVLSSLFIVGGLGYIVQLNVWANFRQPRCFPLTLHSRIVLLTTLLLCLGGTGMVLVLEWSNPQTLGALPLPEKLLAGYFQGVTPRTAGFNTLDYGVLRDTTLLFTMLLMFIGGSPGSTAGGIKTVTFFVLVASAWSMVRGRGELTVFGRRITALTVVKAGSIALLSSGILVSALFLLSATQNLPLLPLMFESFSAFGTVGLSTGVTAELNPAGKLLIIVLMYLGRIGPTTFAIALLQQAQDEGIKYPAEGVLVG